MYKNTLPIKVNYFIYLYLLYLFRPICNKFIKSNLKGYETLLYIKKQIMLNSNSESKTY